MRATTAICLLSACAFHVCSALADPPDVGLHGDQWGLINDWLHLLNDNKFTQNFWNTFALFDDQVRKAAQQNNGVLFYIEIDRDVNTNIRSIKIFKPLATGPDFRRTLTLTLAASPDSYVSDPTGSGHQTIYGYTFAYLGKDGKIYRGIANDQLFKEAAAEARNLREIQYTRQQRVQEQGTVVRQEQQDWNNHLERVKQQEDIDSLEKMLQGSFDAALANSQPPVDIRQWMWMVPTIPQQNISPYLSKDVIKVPTPP